MFANMKKAIRSILLLRFSMFMCTVLVLAGALQAESAAEVRELRGEVKAGYHIVDSVVQKVSRHNHS